MTLEQLVEFRAIALCQPCCLGHIPVCDLEQFSQVLSFKLEARGFERGQIARFAADRGLQQRWSYDRGGREGDGLLHDVVQLPYIARPRMLYLYLHRILRETVEGLPVASRQSFQEMCGEHGYVLATG